MMSKKIHRTRIVIIGFTGLIVFLGGTVFFSGSHRPREKEIKATRPDADFHLKKVTFREFQRDIPVWKAVAENARIFQDDDLALLKDIQATFYQGNGDYIMFTGNQGQVKLSSLDISVRGNIRAKTGDGTRLFADSLNWHNKERRGVSEDKIRIIRDNMEIRGIGLEFNPDQQVITIKKRVSTLIGMDNG